MDKLYAGQNAHEDEGAVEIQIEAFHYIFILVYLVVKSFYFFQNSCLDPKGGIPGPRGALVDERCCKA